ncbi:MAG: hypothetical protein ACI856_001855, partial [Kiritimatiellia bacterium]
MGICEKDSEDLGVKTLKILHITNRRSQIETDGPFAAALRELGELVLVEQARELSDEEV